MVGAEHGAGGRLGCGVPGGASPRGTNGCHPTSVTPWVSPHGCNPGIWPGRFGKVPCQSHNEGDVPGFESVPVRVFRGEREGKGTRPILIMTLEALPNYIVSLKTATQIFMSGTFYSHCNQ